MIFVTTIILVLSLLGVVFIVSRFLEYRLERLRIERDDVQEMFERERLRLEQLRKEGK